MVIKEKRATLPAPPQIEGNDKAKYMPLLAAVATCQHPLCHLQHVQNLSWDKSGTFRCTQSPKDKNKKEREEVETLELEIKRAEVERRAKRLLSYDDVPTLTDSSLDAFCESFDFEADTERLPTLVQRTDGETVLYAGKLNTIYGLPGSGKSWVAIVAVLEAVLRGGNVMYWDFEDTRQTFKRRSLMMGFDPQVHADNFKYIRGDLHTSPAAVLEAQQWLSTAVDPVCSLVVIDAAESAGCPADGANVVPWYQSHVDPWLDAGAGVLLVDHIPKRQEDRPRGPIGSNHKLAKVTGVSLKVSGVPWTKKIGGKILLHTEKDRGGDMPAPVTKCVAAILGGYQDDGDSRTFGYTIEPPDSSDNAEDMPTAILQAVGEAGPEGVKGVRNLIKMVKGRNDDKHASIAVLVDGGLLDKERKGKADIFTITTAGTMAIMGLD